MSRSFALAVFSLIVALPASAADPAPHPAPELLLSPTSQFYLRWDGITAHNAAYKQSIWGGVMAGPTGDSIRALLAMAPKYLGNVLLAQPLLEGQSPAELKANLTDLKNANRIVDLITDKGVIVTAEVREPLPSIRGVAGAVSGLLSGKAPGIDALTPDAQLIVLVPDVGDQSEVLFAALRLTMQQLTIAIEPFTSEGRSGFRMVTTTDSPQPYTIHAAWWAEGKHFIFYLGTLKPERAISEVVANSKKGGITGHALYKRIQQHPGYESITRGFVDTTRFISVIKSVGGALVPGLNQRLDDLGANNLKAIVFNSGFDGKESRATYEFDIPGERKGLAKVLKGQPLGLNDLPPLPPDVSRFSALRVDPAAVYDAGVNLIEFLTLQDSFGPEEDAKTPAEAIRLRREFLKKEADKLTGITIAEDLIPHLGDKLVMFQSPTERLSVFGTVVCISLKDPVKVRAAADRIQRGLEAFAGGQIKLKKKMYQGTEIRELYSPVFGIVSPSYAIVGDWLVIAGHPQLVQGLILRSQGKLPRWKPDAATAARLGKLPRDCCAMQYCDPRSTVQNLCCVGPLFTGLLAAQTRSSGSEADSDYFDVSIVPNGHELSSHLFPNWTVTRDDGKSIRIEVNESFSLPLEFIGLEPLTLGFGFLGLVF